LAPGHPACNKITADFSLPESPKMTASFNDLLDNLIDEEFGVIFLSLRLASENLFKL
jgi:hypothetical protein